jgi:hypothetical protein
MELAAIGLPRITNTSLDVDGLSTERIGYTLFKSAYFAQKPGPRCPFGGDDKAAYPFTPLSMAAIA